MKMIGRIAVVVLMFVAVQVNATTNLFVTSATLTTKVWSAYLDGADNNASGFVALDEPVVQTDLWLGFPNGFYFDLWHSVGLDDGKFNSNYGDEIDYVVGWKGEVAGMTLDTGVAYWDLYKLFRSPRGDLVLPYVVASKLYKVGAHEFTPYGKIAVAIPTKGEVTGGTFIQSGLRHSTSFCGFMNPNQAVAFTWNDGGYGDPPHFVFNYIGSLNHRLGKHFSVDFPAVRLAQPLGLRDRAVAVSWGVILSASY